MTTLLLRGVILVLMAAALATGTVAMRPALQKDMPRPPAPGPATGAKLKGDPARLHQLLRRTTPFRVSGRPPAVRYGVPPAQAQAPVPSIPKPALSLTGVMVGTESAAILEGIPGQDGPVVVRAGETRGVLRIVAVDADRVVVRGLDTTWYLQVREPWH